ncbi:MAG: hypothetical protein KKH94_03450, partial [Candidatus Omnitrophica bacterium]|nr:hypothetical protein [Candidatus Omnitrophota bacterium]
MNQKRVNQAIPDKVADTTTWRGNSMGRKIFKTIALVTLLFFLSTQIDSRWTALRNTAYAQSQQTQSQPPTPPEKPIEDGETPTRPHLPSESLDELWSSTTTFTPSEEPVEEETFEDDEGIFHTISKDDDGRVGREELYDGDPANGGTLVESRTYTYDADGRITSVQTTDHTSNTTGTYTYAYDEQGRVASGETEKDGDRYSYTYAYDEAGNLASGEGEDDAGNTYTYAYNEEGRISSAETEDAEGNTYAYEYDENERITSMQAKDTSGITYTYAYDEEERVVSVQAIDYDKNIYTYEYDEEGNITSVYAVDQYGTTYTYEYDGAWHITSVELTFTDEDGILHKCTQDAFGRIEQAQLYDGDTLIKTHTYTYESNTYSITTTDQQSNETTVQTYGKTQERNGYTYSYIYDDKGRILTIEEDDAAEEKTTIVFDYLYVEENGIIYTVIVTNEQVNEERTELGGKYITVLNSSGTTVNMQELNRDEIESFTIGTDATLNITTKDGEFRNYDLFTGEVKQYSQIDMPSDLGQTSDGNTILPSGVSVRDRTNPNVLKIYVGRRVKAEVTYDSNGEIKEIKEYVFINPRSSLIEQIIYYDSEGKVTSIVASLSAGDYIHFNRDKDMMGARFFDANGRLIKIIENQSVTYELSYYYSETKSLSRMYYEEYADSDGNKKFRVQRVVDVEGEISTYYYTSEDSDTIHYVRQGDYTTLYYETYTNEKEEEEQRVQYSISFDEEKERWTYTDYQYPSNSAVLQQTEQYIYNAETSEVGELIAETFYAPYTNEDEEEATRVSKIISYDEENDVWNITEYEYESETSDLITQTNRYVYDRPLDEKGDLNKEDHYEQFTYQVKNDWDFAIYEAPRSRIRFSLNYEAAEDYWTQTFYEYETGTQDITKTVSWKYDYVTGAQGDFVSEMYYESYLNKYGKKKQRIHHSISNDDGELRYSNYIYNDDNRTDQPDQVDVYDTDLFGNLISSTFYMVYFDTALNRSKRRISSSITFNEDDGTWSYSDYVYESDGDDTLDHINMYKYDKETETKMDKLISQIYYETYETKLGEKKERITYSITYDEDSQMPTFMYYYYREQTDKINFTATSTIETDVNVLHNLDPTTINPLNAPDILNDEMSISIYDEEGKQVDVVLSLNDENKFVYTYYTYDDEDLAYTVSTTTQLTDENDIAALRELAIENLNSDGDALASVLAQYDDMSITVYDESGKEVNCVWSLNDENAVVYTYYYYKESILYFTATSTTQGDVNSLTNFVLTTVTAADLREDMSIAVYKEDGKKVDYALSLDDKTDLVYTYYYYSDGKLHFTATSITQDDVNSLDNLDPAQITNDNAADTLKDNMSIAVYTDDGKNVDYTLSLDDGNKLVYTYYYYSDGKLHFTATSNTQTDVHDLDNLDPTTITTANAAEILKDDMSIAVYDAEGKKVDYVMNLNADKALTYTQYYYTNKLDADENVVVDS